MPLAHCNLPGANGPLEIAHWVSAVQSPPPYPLPLRTHLLCLLRTNRLFDTLQACRSQGLKPLNISETG